MLFRYVSLCLIAAAGVRADDFDFLLKGFEKGASLVKSGPDAVCAAGYVSVTVTPNNTRLLIDEPTNTTRATAILFELLKVNSTLAVTAAGPANRFTRAFRIAARLCYPAAGAPDRVQTAQLLTHGFTLDKDYWDYPGPNSHVRAAARAGYATLAYDRLGAGESEKPNGLQVVQTAAHIEIARVLTERLRDGSVGGRKFRKVVGVGHSYGSIIGTGLVGRYPSVWDAVVATGFSANFAYVGCTLSTLGLEQANSLGIPRFAGVSGAYLSPARQYGVQYSFYLWPYYEQSIFDTTFAKRSAGTLGETFTFGSALQPTQFTGPVDVVNGIADYPYCGGNCSTPTDQAAAAIPALYPRASSGSRSFLLPNAGHNYNGQFGAPAAYAHINKFLKDNGL